MNKVILAIDDDAVILDYYRTVLGRFGEVRTAANLEEARRQFGGVSLILLDFDLAEDRDMFQDVVKELRPVAPILLCSGVQDVQVPALGAMLGIAGYWNKGSDRDGLIALVAQHLAG